MINIGLIGYGYWGPNLARNLADTRGVCLAAIADEIPERLQIATGRHPGVAVYGTGSVLLADESIDAVVIATPLNSHYALSRAAIECGKHVLVEKPMAASLREARELECLAQKQDVRLSVDHTFVYSGPIRKIRSLISAGDLGDVLYLDSIRANFGIFQQDSNVIWDLAAHDFAIMDHLLAARPAGVSVHATHLPGYRHEAVAHIAVHFDNGCLGHFHVSWLAPVKMRHMIICGSQRTIVFDDVAPDEKVRVYNKSVSVRAEGGRPGHHGVVSYRTGDMYAPKLDPSEALSLVTREFADAIGQRRRPLTDGAAGVRVMTLLDAAERSLRAGGERVSVCL